MHQDMEDSLEGLLDRAYYCPHINEDNCLCRKPKPRLLLNAQNDLGIDLESSWLVGDSHTDIEAGRAAGCRTIFINNQYNAGKLEKCDPHHVINHHREVADILD